jgi:hypothetical protein
MKGRLEPVSFKSTAALVEHLMRNTRSSVTFQIAEFQREQHDHLTRLLERLSRYGDRIHIRMDDSSRKVIRIDSSVFNLGLQPE